MTPGYERAGKSPVIHETAWVAETAVLVGDVRIAAHARVLHGAVLTADGGFVEVGEHSIVMEQAVIRGTAQHPVRIGDHCVLGVHAAITGAQLGDRVFIATGASIFNGARIGSGSEVRVGAVVHVNTELDPGTTVPIGWIAAGSPAQLFPPDRHDELWSVQRELDFPRTVFGVDRNAPDSLREITERWSRALGRNREDRRLD